MAKAKGGKDRPKSSAHKRKKGGSPDGSDTPMDGQLTALDNYPQPPIVDVIRGPDIEELMITESDMFAMRPPPSTSPKKETKSVHVRKQRILSNAPTKTVTVLKKIDTDLPDVAVYSAGPRFSEAGEILSYSILGPVHHYKQSVLSRGNEDLIEKQIFQEISTAPRPIFIEPTAPDVIKETKETHALKNWERQLQQHSRQMSFLAQRTGKSECNLLMNSIEEYRAKQEERTIIDRAIPVMDRGKGYRVGSEFWSLPQQIGDDESAIVMTLNQSEQGQLPDLEHIGRPFSTEGTQGHIYPWKRNKFFEQRRKELTSVLCEKEQHKPDFAGLYIQGSKELRPEGDRDVVEQQNTADETPENLPEPEQAPENKGPRLEINGVESVWGAKRDPTTIRMLFTTDAGLICTQHIKLNNTGTTAIFYSWKFVPKENKLNTIMEGNIQRFYFSINDGVILPGQEMSIPLIFLSKQAGIYSECWQFITKPVLNNGAPIIVALKGVALKRDIYKAEKEKIEELLEKRQTQYSMKLLVEELVRGVHSPPPGPPAEPPSPTLHERFNANNPYLHYQSDYFEQARELWASVSEEEIWDERLDSLREAILSIESIEEQTEKMEEFNALRAKFTQPRPKPFANESYDMCYGCLRSAVDALEREDKVLRATLALPARVHIDEVPPPEPDATSEKTAPDSKKGKKEVEKKKKEAPKEKPRTVSKGGKKSDIQIIPDEEELVEKKEWQEITDPVLKAKYKEKLHLLVYNLLSTSMDQISLVLEDQTGKPF